MEYRFIDLSKTLGKATKNYLRTVSGYKRLPKNQIDDLVFANNLQYEEQQIKKKEQQIKKKEAKKQTKKAIKDLPSFIEQNEEEQKKIKAQRREEQKQQAIKQFEDRLIKNILQNVGGKYELKINSFFRKFSNDKNAIRQMLNSINNVLLSNGKKINLRVNNINYVLNPFTIEKLFTLLPLQLVHRVAGVAGSSDEAFLNELEDAETIEIYEFVKTNKYEKANGAFFKYNHVLDFDLSKYQIYKAEEQVDYDNCLTFALKQGGLCDEKLEKLRLLTKTDNIPVCKLKEICEQLQIRINLKKTKKGDYGFFNYGEQFEETYTIGLLDEHYFILDDAKITSYAIKNYHEIKDIKDWHKIAKDDLKRRNDRFIDSFSAIKILILDLLNQKNQK